MTELPEAKVQPDRVERRQLALHIAALLGIVVGTVSGIVRIGVADFDHKTRV
ncbi:MAG: hypothetical protein H0V17_27825, partial [Deltaproteobacteria bacterium]|nr:hypothetical protein [Deltaproteobacteria bacterium]